MSGSSNRGAAPSGRISIVVPCLNGARYLPQALGSLERQPNADVIVVDGGSTDGTVDIIREWENRLPLRWISERDNGQADAINKGIAMATGDVVGWLNADDMLEGDTIARVAHEFNWDPELEFVWGFCLVIAADGSPLYIQNPFVREDFDLLRRHRNFVPQPGSFFRRSLCDRFGLLDVSYEFMFDYEFFLRLSGHVRARFVPSVLARFRMHADSKTAVSYKGFLKEEERAFRANGGSLVSPFMLDMMRYRFVASPAQWLKKPFRTVLWRLLGLPRGSRIRS
jgi:glycosyltransferase involved in cell wall biosynthesis